MKELHITLPTSWNALSDWQLKRIALLFHTREPGTLFDVEIFKILLCTTDKLTVNTVRKARKTLREIPLSQLKPYYGFIYKEHNRTKFVPTMVVKKNILYAPMEKLLNLSVKEFAAAEDLHAMWYKNRDREALEYLAAVLYTTSATVRPEYHLEELEAKAAEFTSVPLEDLLAMELTYAGCKNHIVEKFPTVFPKNGKSKPSKKYGFGKVILQMSGGKFGDHDKTERTKIYTFLGEMEENLKPKTK